MRDRAFLIVFVLFFTLLLPGCIDVTEPPTVDSVQQCFGDHYNEIQTIVDFLSAAEYENIYISETNGFMQANLTKTEIPDKSVSSAVSKLLKREYLNIYKSGNTIQFTQWRGSMDIICGIAYSVNGTDSPQIQYRTALVPLDKEGWYYFVSDYNKWRAKNDVDVE